MVYLSLALILLGILIFLYSIILDSKKRREGHTPFAPGDSMARGSAGRLSRRNAAASQKTRGAGPDNAAAGAKRSPGSGLAGAAGPGNGPVPGEQIELQAVLFEDSSNVIDYSNESGTIDPSLQGYRKIKRIGSGTLSVGKGGVTFFMGKKLYRYDFHRVRDLKQGSRHVALFLQGSKAVKLFIVEPGSGIISAVNDAYREYVRSSV